MSITVIRTAIESETGWFLQIKPKRENKKTKRRRRKPRKDVREF